jgi:peptidoglycan/LPS O-acetylase OafA/YrhL
MVPHLLAHCFYLHNFIYGAFPGAVNTVAWSLEVEVQFSCLVPLLSLVFAISDARLRRAVILVAMAMLGFASSPLYRTVHFHYFIGYYLAFFLAGFLVCDFYITRNQWKPSFTWDILALCLWPLVWLPGHCTTHIAPQPRPPAPPHLPKSNPTRVRRTYNLADGNLRSPVWR